MPAIFAAECHPRVHVCLQHVWYRSRSNTGDVSAQLEESLIQALRQVEATIDSVVSVLSNNLPSFTSASSANAEVSFTSYICMLFLCTYRLCDCVCVNLCVCVCITV